MKKLLPLLACAVLCVAQENGTCLISGDGAGCVEANQSAHCKVQGFDPEKLGCKTCRVLEKRLKEAAVDAKALTSQCLACCTEEPILELFPKARLIADAQQQERDQDLHDFIKRKAPGIRNLEVDYQAGSSPAVELETTDGSGRVLRADVRDWKSDHLVQFLNLRLESAENDMDGGVGVAGAWSAEIQSCSGWRLNQLPEARRFIKEPGHADTYVGLKVNFIPHHNPDLVFFNQHGEEMERLDLGRYSTQQIHDMLVSKGFKRKEAKKYRGEIRTCSGWRLDQLPEVRRFVLGEGNADSYVGLRLNFVPHHPPVFYLLDENGKETESIDMSGYSFDGLQELMAQKGFLKKELL